MPNRWFARIDPKATVISGIGAGIVYLATMETDIRVTGLDLDDLKLLGRPFVKNAADAKLAGLPIHFVNSVALAALYGAVARPRLPGPGWFKGLTFALVENTVLFPLAVFEMSNPAIRNGEIDRYFSFKAYLQNIPRHATYGLTV